MSRGNRSERIYLDDVDRQDFLKTACDSVHLNPVRANLLKPEERVLACLGELPSLLRLYVIAEQDILVPHI